MKQILALAIAALGICLAAGCRTPASLHVWHPAMVPHREVQRVAIAPLEGPRDLCVQLSIAVESKVPDTARVNLVSQAELDRSDSLHLVSFENGAESDLALLPAARRSGVDCLLVGEVLKHMESPAALEISPLNGGSEVQSASQEETGTLAISWRVIDVASGTTKMAIPIAVSSETLASSHPDLLATTLTDRERKIEAAARETWKLLAPFVVQQQVQLANPWVGREAKRIRQANQLAAMGRWPDAERIWRAVSIEQPRSHAAMHNLAIAAIARQDFDEAKRLAMEALSRRDSRLYQETLMWIKLQRRQHDVAFGLPAATSDWQIIPQ